MSSTKEYISGLQIDARTQTEGEIPWFVSPDPYKTGHYENPCKTPVKAKKEKIMRPPVKRKLVFEVPESVKNYEEAKKEMIAGMKERGEEVPEGAERTFKEFIQERDEVSSDADTDSDGEDRPKYDTTKWDTPTIREFNATYVSVVTPSSTKEYIYKNPF